MYRGKRYKVSYTDLSSSNKMLSNHSSPMFKSQIS